MSGYYSLRIKGAQIQQLLQGLVQGLGQQEGDRRALQNGRHLVQDLVRQTTMCDGSSTTNVRNWVREIQLAFNQVGNGGIVEVITKTVTRALRFETERFIEGYMNNHQVGRAAIPWNEICDHVTAQFLNIDEAAALRDEVEGLRQSAYEPEIQYASRFSEVADVAYPVALRNADMLIIILIDPV